MRGACDALSALFSLSLDTTEATRQRGRGHAAQLGGCIVVSPFTALPPRAARPFSGHTPFSIDKTSSLDCK